MTRAVRHWVALQRVALHRTAPAFAGMAAGVAGMTAGVAGMTAWVAGMTALVAGMTVLPAVLHAQAITGVVLEDGPRSPVPGAEVRVLDAVGTMVGSTLTGADGEFHVRLDTAGQYEVFTSRVGYFPVRADSLTVAEDGTLELRILLGLQAVPLEPIEVVGTRYTPSRILRFRERAASIQRLGQGRVYTRADIDRIRPHTAAQLVDAIVWARNCRPTVYLDGLEIGPSLNTVAGDEIEGIEIYRGMSEIPAEFFRHGMCGLAMVWTRSDPPGMKPLTWRRTAVAVALLVLIGLAAQ